MAILNSSEGTLQADSEAPDSSDIPPHEATLAASKTVTPADATLLQQRTVGHTPSVPLPAPESGAYEKHPGHTRNSLQKLVTSVHDIPAVQEPKSAIPKSADPTKAQTTPNHQQHPSTNGSSTSSPTTSESDWASQPSTRPPSQAPSRAPSMSAGTSGGKITGGPGKAQPESTPSSPVVSTRPGKPASVHSDSGSHKFNLKDLLANGPKLARRSSQKSASSRKSDSDFDGPVGAARSTAGDSATSLSKKYGVCQKVAIGKGATSVVRLAHKWDRTEEKLYAVKEFRKRRKNETEKQYIKKLTAEFCISSTLHHPNIVETVDLVQDESQHWCEVMEFCPGGDLYAAIKKGGMSESEVECCFKQILNGVGYLHSQGVAHRDIKPENLFFDTKGQLKIGDYGASTVYRLPWEATIHMSTGLCGSEPYIAPEQFMGRPYDARLVDIWACGIVYYCLHFQELPWRAAQPQTDTLYAAYIAACANSNSTISACPPTINNLSPRACRPLIRKMLEPDPNHRASIEDCLAHPWIKSIEVCHDVSNPHHVHSSARALAHAQLRDVEREPR